MTKGKNILKKVLEWTGYGILVALLFFMLLAQLFPNLEKIVDDHIVQMGLLAGLLAFLLYFDSRISRTEEVRQEVNRLSVAILEEFSELRSGVIQSGNFHNLFEMAMPTSNRVKKLRIFALSTDKIFDAFHENSMQYRADELSLLLHSSESSVNNLKLWEGLAPDKIKVLDSVFYTPTPSSYYIIFDKNCMILGGYYPKNIPSGSYYIAPFLIRDAQVIENYINLHKKTMEFYRAST